VNAGQTPYLKTGRASLLKTPISGFILPQDTWAGGKEAFVTIDGVPEQSANRGTGKKRRKKPFDTFSLDSAGG
jgi:hypothetical protein